ncbi:DUF2333 family protein [Marinobacter panjinensis]|uniref:DUF2333 family protein n=1 Tax=Marinobacter panjinensis TaxID=2576384 RepID=A0A4U6R425_9GAMM|nr:DUF2333 family protein [Marinobacter panjinensis]MCR8916096.1 DUF2333 family protein [Marinobacter panjinensis]TKV68420.1 DUF2333 family protein [Marinobacter panjinensis]
MSGKIRQYFSDRKDDLRDFSGGGGVVGKLILAVLVVYFLVALVLGMIWSSEPDVFSVREHTRAVATEMQREPVTGFATTVTMIRVAETLLEKPGGYVSNDMFPPGLWLDNMPNWEFGVLVQLRDFSRAMRRDISRSQSQSAEDRDLVIAEPQLHFDSGSWALPSTETEYRRGIKALHSYLDRLSRPDQPDAQFFARADNLANWLGDLETRLGSLSRTLGESVGKASVSDAVSNINPDDPLSEDTMGEEVKTSWTKIDDVFYEARGSAWALLHIFRAIEVDFRKVLNDKNALASAKQIIIELEGTQGEMWSPVILNGSGFGVLANHSLTMAAYLSRASAAISDMRDLLTRG